MAIFVSGSPSASPILRVIALAVSVAFATAACKTMPKVAYQRIYDASQLDGTEFDTFAFQDSVIIIDAKRDEKGNALEPLQLTVTSVPVDYTDYKVAMYRRGSLGVKTNVVISKYENTAMPKEVGSEVVDTRIDLIKQIGGLLVTAVTFSEPESKVEKFPKRINVSSLLRNSDDTGKGKVVESDEEPTVEINVAAVEKDAMQVPKKGDPNDSLFGHTTSNFYYPACRTATVTVTVECKTPDKTVDGKKVVGKTESCKQDLPPVKISDSRFLQSVNLPQKGKIVMHSQCGVSVSTDKDSGVSSNAAIVAELAKQVAAVKEAVDKKNEAEKKK
ncbi:hypothetical protein [Lysobacter sp. P5_B9]